MKPEEIWSIWDEVVDVDMGFDPVPFANAIIDAVPTIGLERISQVLACEIECGIFEQHVAPALEVARNALSSTQGADARPVDAREALTDAVVEKWLDRQGNDSGQGLCDMYTSAVRAGFRLARSTLTDFYATRGTAPSNSSAASIFAPEVPWWKVTELAEKHGKGWSQFSGWSFLNDDDLHAFACAIAATAPRDKT